MSRREKIHAPEPPTDWERLLKSKAIAFEVEKLSPALKAARWISNRDPKARNAYRYLLPKK